MEAPGIDPLPVETYTPIHENYLKSRTFHGWASKFLGEEDRFRLSPMGFLLSEPRLEIFFDFDLFSCLNEGF